MRRLGCGGRARASLRRLMRLATRRDRRLAVSIVLTMAWLGAWAMLRVCGAIDICPP